MRRAATEAAASVADLGTLLPIAAGLVLVNGVDPVAALSVAGALFVAGALAYRIPMPVQPIKAAAAIAIAVRARPEVIAGAGLVLGALLVLLALTGLAPKLARAFPKPVIRGNQLGVGILLVAAAAALVRREAGSGGAAWIVAAAILVALLVVRAGRAPLALALVAGGIAWSLATGGAPAGLSPDPALPGIHLPRWSDVLAAITLLVIPQIPLTLSNAVVGVADLARDYYGSRASRATETRICLTSGIANLAAGAVGGMPLCHGSSGLTAYHRFGARTGAVNLVAGAALLGLGLGLGRGAVAAFALIPVAVLAALLAYTGVRHAMLVADQRGWGLGIAIATGAVGAATRNLAIGMAIGLPLALVLGRARR